MKTEEKEHGNSEESGCEEAGGEKGRCEEARREEACSEESLLQEVRANAGLPVCGPLGVRGVSSLRRSGWKRP